MDIPFERFVPFARILSPIMSETIDEVGEADTVSRGCMGERILAKGTNLSKGMSMARHPSPTA
jgi:hypothetical protein